MKVAYFRWKDAVAKEAADGQTRPSQAKAVELREIGFLLDERTLNMFLSRVSRTMESE
jgi:hypothetical protein